DRERDERGGENRDRVRFALREKRRNRSLRGGGTAGRHRHLRESFRGQLLLLSGAPMILFARPNFVKPAALASAIKVSTVPYFAVGAALMMRSPCDETWNW